MRNYKHSNDDIGKMYIKIVANYFNSVFLSSQSLQTIFRWVIGLSFDWLIQNVSLPVRDRDWRKSPDLAQRYCSTPSIATVSLETKPNKGPSYSCCQGRKTRIPISFP